MGDFFYLVAAPTIESMKPLIFGSRVVIRVSWLILDSIIFKLRYSAQDVPSRWSGHLPIYGQNIELFMVKLKWCTDLVITNHYSYKVQVGVINLIKIH